MLVLPYHAILMLLLLSVLLLMMMRLLSLACILLHLPWGAIPFWRLHVQVLLLPPLLLHCTTS